MWKNKRALSYCYLLSAISSLAGVTDVSLDTSDPGDVSNQYIVLLKGEADQDKCANEHLLKRTRIFKHALNAFVCNLSTNAVERLSRDARVLIVAADRPSGRASGQNVSTAISRMAVRHFPASNIDGLDDRVGVDVAVLDSGIQTDHPDLNVVDSADFTGEGFYGTNPHGTQCAGIIGALDNDFGVVGVAPGVRLWSVRVIRNDNTYYLSDLIAGLNYVASHASEIAVVNCSLNTFYGVANSRIVYQQAISALVNQGIVVIASAGNDSGDLAGPDGVLDNDDDSFPAALPEVLAVSNMDPVTDEFVANSNFSRSRHLTSFVSSPGGAIDVAAPGNNISTTTLNGGYVVGFSGTSASAPCVSGLAALYIATHGRATNATGVYQIRQAIISAAESQSQWQSANTSDPDSYHEGLAVASVGWLTNAPRFTAIARESQGINVRFTTITGYTHTLQYAASLGEPFLLWTNLVVTDGIGSEASFSDQTRSSMRVYRLMTRPSPWPGPQSFFQVTNIGSLGATGNGLCILAIPTISGAIVSEAGNTALRTPLEFPGSRARIPFHSTLNPNGPFSVEFWSKPGQTAELSCAAASVEFLSRRSGWILYQANSALTDGNGFAFRCYNTSGDTSVTTASANISIDTNNWYHVVGVFDGNNVSLYVNGISVASSSLPGGQSFRPNPTATLNFGVRSDGAFWQVGALDEAAFYTNALSAARVLAHYQAGTNVLPSIPFQEVVLADHPAGYWRFDEH